MNPKKISPPLFVLIILLLGVGSITAKTRPNPSGSLNPSSTNGTVLNLSDFGSVGDGVTDDGPALQRALDALADLGGGTLLVPEGQYAIETPVAKNFAGLTVAVSILGVESNTPLAPPTSTGAELAKGLDLVSEIYPRTGPDHIAISIGGLDELLIKDIAFIGTPGVLTDAWVSVNLHDIGHAIVRHCEFYGLSSFKGEGGIIKATRSSLQVDQSKFLGSTAASGLYVPVVENIEWRGISVTESHFVDYGLRPNFFSKTNFGAPISWINIGNAMPPAKDSPRREVTIRDVFLDEGSYFGLTSLPYRYSPPSAPIDLIYITRFRMNVSNFGTFGHLIFDARRLLVEKSIYGWSHHADSAINMINVGNAILDQLTLEAAAQRIRADSTTQRLTVINTAYSDLASLAQSTAVLNTTEEDDPVQYVRRQFETVLGREPDPAGHFYWSDLLIRCEDDAECQENKRTDLNNYLDARPLPTFSVTGRVTDQDGNPLAHATIALTGSQSVMTTTNDTGDYAFSNLPTSGVYTLKTSKEKYRFSEEITMTTPVEDQVKNFSGVFSPYKISGQIVTSSGTPTAGVTVTLSGTLNDETTTNSSGNFSFQDLPAGGTYFLTPSDPVHVFSPTSRTISNLTSDQNANFTAVTYRISGRVARTKGGPLSGVTITLSGDLSASTTTDATGDYNFKNLLPGRNYTVTPSLSPYSFDPSSRTYNDLEGDQTADFAVVTYTIGGRITKSNGEGLPGVEVVLSGATNSTALTSQSGEYVFEDLPAGFDYTVMPTLASYLIEPEDVTYSELESDKSADFSGYPIPLLLTAENSDLAVALHSLKFVAGPFTLEDDSVFTDGRRTRIIVFAQNLDSTDGESSASITAEAQDIGGTKYPLEIEFVGGLEGVSAITQLVIVLSRTLPEDADLRLSIRQGPVASNKARIRIVSPEP